MNTPLLLAALAVGAPALKEPPAPPPGIDGEWAIESRVIGGQPDPAFRPGRVEVAGGRWTLPEPGGRPQEWVVDLDPAARPPAITLFRADDPGRQQPPAMSGIYKVDGDTLTVCYVFEGPRPAAFASPAGSKVRLMTLRRVKDK